MTDATTKCPWCGLLHGPRCPEVKAIEYFPDGTAKRVEFLTPADRMPLLGRPGAPPAPHVAVAMGALRPGSGRLWNGRCGPDGTIQWEDAGPAPEPRS
jgi:hypothetical protein